MTCIVKRKGLSRSFLYVLYPPCRDGLRPVKRALNRNAPGIFLANSEILTVLCSLNFVKVTQPTVTSLVHKRHRTFREKS